MAASVEAETEAEARVEPRASQMEAELAKMKKKVAALESSAKGKGKAGAGGKTAGKRPLALVEDDEVEVLAGPPAAHTRGAKKAKGEGKSKAFLPAEKPAGWPDSTWDNAVVSLCLVHLGRSLD